MDKTEFNDVDRDELLYGVYARHARPGSRLETELYWLGNTRDDVTFNGTSGDARRHTFGYRGKGALAERADWEVEADWQIGEVGSADVSAYSLATILGHTFDAKGDPRAWIGLDWASGDDSPGGDLQTFDQLYPLGHAHLGFVDTIGRQNVIDTSTGTSWKANSSVTIAAFAHSFWAENSDDAIYNAGGGIVRPGASYDSNWIGFETDLVARWKVASNLEFEAGYMHFFAGDALSDSSADDDIDFTYFAATTGF